MQEHLADCGQARWLTTQRVVLSLSRLVTPERGTLIGPETSRYCALIGCSRHPKPPTRGVFCLLLCLCLYGFHAWTGSIIGPGVSNIMIQPIIDILSVHVQCPLIIVSLYESWDLECPTLYDNVTMSDRFNKEINNRQRSN